MPDFLRAVALALGPEHFAQVCGDLGIRPLCERAPKEFLGIVQMPEAEMRPAHAVEDERVSRRECVRLLDELQALRRSLRAVVDLTSLGQRTIHLDCDVLQADGGTRTAAITGAFVALHDAVGWLQKRKPLPQSPIRDFVAAVSVGIHQGTPVLDLDYAEDSACGCDMNVVMTGAGNFVEVQGTAEGEAFGRAQLDELLALAERGIRELIAHQRSALGLG